MRPFQSFFTTTLILGMCTDPRYSYFELFVSGSEYQHSNLFEQVRTVEQFERKVKNLRPVLEQNLVVLNLPVRKKSLQQKICSTYRLKFAELHKDGEKKVNFNNFNITYLF